MIPFHIQTIAQDLDVPLTQAFSLGLKKFYSEQNNFNAAKIQHTNILEANHSYFLNLSITCLDTQGNAIADDELTIHFNKERINEYTSRIGEIKYWLQSFIQNISFSQDVKSNQISIGFAFDFLYNYNFQRTWL